MKTRKVFILLMLATLVISTSACSSISSLFSTTPTTSNFYMATDKTGTTHTTSYGTSADFFVFFDVSNIPTGTAFQAKWYVLNVAGQNPSVPFQTTDYTYPTGTTTVFMGVTNDAGDWPTGNYKVEIYMNSAKVGELTFSVK